jgi:hypothetical protein
MTAFEINRNEFGKMFPKMDVDCFVKKPIRVAELANLVKAVLNKAA